MKNDSKAKSGRRPVKVRQRSIQKKSAKRPKHRKNQQQAKGEVQIIPLGGWGEIGKNMTAIRFDNDIIVIDVGLGFPEEEQPGVDLIIPDFSYLAKHKDKLRGVFLTHGHEDHIGAIAWFMQEFHCPVYGLPLTMKLVKEKLDDRERGGSKKNLEQRYDRLNTCKPGDVLRAGKLSVEFIHVNHSIADAAALLVKTPIGNIYHSGDFKIDYTPVEGEPIDLPRIAEIGREGLLAYIGESTNVERPGYTPSEQMVGQSFSKFFSQIEGRIFVATFSSNVWRLQQIIEAAEEHGKKVGLLGYSMRKVFEAANSLGYIQVEPGTMQKIDDLVKLPDNEIVIISTGTQGEPMAALNRMAHSEHRQVNIKDGDTVLLSSSMIPGNETAIYEMINELYMRGATVIYQSLADIHVSGHAYRGELQTLMNLLKPKFFIPNHGEYRHLKEHMYIAEDAGVKPENMFLLNNGDVLTLNAHEGKVTEYVDAGGVIIDGIGVGDIDKKVLKERRLLADDGMISITLAVNDKKGELAADPAILTLGFLYDADIEAMEAGIVQRINSYVGQQKKGALSQNLKSNELKNQLKDYLYENTKRRPIMLFQVITV